MAKIVIDINDKDYKLFMELMSGNLWRNNYQNIIGKCLDAIKHGKVLPKGYGRLIDADACKDEAFRIFPCKDIVDTNIRRLTESAIACVPTIIEADKVV